MPDKHALLSPSASYRWIHCPGSVAFTMDMPNTTSAFAEEGTKAHRLCELYMKDRLYERGLNTMERLEYETTWEDADDEMRDSVKCYCEEIMKRVEHAKYLNLFVVEQSLDISSITGEPGAHGTADCLVQCDHLLYVIDFKYGKGVPVSCENNPQLSIYGIAAYDSLDPLLKACVSDIRLVIVQPRIGNISEWGFKASEVESRRAAFREHADCALSPVDEYRRNPNADMLVLEPGEKQCRFCPGKAVCPALAKQVQRSVVEAFVDHGDAPPCGIPVPSDPDGLSRALTWIPLIQQWCESVESSAKSQLTAGAAVPGYKLVAGRQGPRQWDKSKMDDVESLLKNGLKTSDVYEKKLISPTKASQLAKEGTLSESRWKRLSKLIVRSEGKPSLVADSDPRPALSCAADAFGALPNGNV